MHGLAQRRLTPELMDDPSLDPQEHDHALAGLRRLNAAAGSARPIATAIRRLVPHDEQTITLADVATGSGDVAAAVATRLARTGLAVRLQLIDTSERALAEAADRCRRHGIEHECVQIDATANALAAELDADIAMCSLFLHHLTIDDATGVLAAMRTKSRLGVVASDLKRSRLGYGLAWLAGRVLTRSRVVHVDSLLSVRAGWSRDELASVAHDAGMASATITGSWPERWVLAWDARHG